MRAVALFALGLLATGGDTAAGQPRGDLEQKIVVQRRRIVLDERIYFEHGRGRILPVSFPILDLLAEKLQQNPQIELIQVEGHTDATGPREVNERLSALRARSVRDYLVAKGVKAERLIARGFGADWPVASNLTEGGREKNRRVELVIVQVLKRRVWRRRPPTTDYAVAIRASPGTRERGPEGGSKALAPDSPVYAGDSVETPEGAYAVVRLPGIVLAHLGAGTAVRIETLRGDPGGAGRSGRLRLERGTVRLRGFRPVSEQGALVTVEAGALVASFEKAELRLAREGPNTRLEVLSGEVRARAGASEQTLGPGRGLRAMPDSAPALYPLPPAPRKRSPTRGEVERAHLTWEAMPAAVGYVVEVAKDPDFVDRVAHRELPAAELTLELPAGRYYWQVRSRDRDGFESMSWPILGFVVK